jgi:phospholipid/cholesterol/gamma-HCH transport system substrate-binding protein
MTGKVIRLGVFLVITAALALYIGAKIKDVSLSPRYRLAATFDDVTGLVPGDPVKLAGVPVGQVSSIRLDDSRGMVRFNVDRSVRLPADTTTIAVRWKNLIGQRYLSLDPGTDAARTPAYLPTDGHGVISKTSSAVDVGAVLNALGPLGKAVNPQQLNTIFTAIEQSLNGNGSNINNLVANLDKVAATLASRDQTIGRMLSDYGTVTDVLARRDQEIQTMIQNVVLLSQTFTDNTKLFETTLVNLSSVGTSLDHLLNGNEQQFKGVLDNLAGVTNAISNKLPQLAQGFNGVPAALRSLFSTANGGDYIRVDDSCFQFAPAPCRVLGGYSVP